MRIEKLRTGALAAILLAVNCYVVRDLFGAGFIAQMGSIDGAHIGIPRYLAEHWRDLGWFPLWFDGIPYQNTYPPLLRAIVALAMKLSGTEPVPAYHTVTALLYALGPVTLFWLALRLSGSRGFSFLAAMLYSLFSPSALLGAAIRLDIGSPFNPRRAQTLLVYGDGPHISAITLIPLALLVLDTALRRKRPAWYVLAALAIAAVPLTNWPGAAAFAFAVVAYLAARPETTPKVWLTAAALGAYAYLLACAWLPPSTVAAVRANSEWAGGAFHVGVQHLRYLGLWIVALVLLRAACERFRISPVVRFAIFFAVPLTAIVLAATQLDISILPQPHRYQLEVEMGIALIAVFALRPLAARMGRVEIAIALAGFCVFCWIQAKTYRNYTRALDRPLDIHTTVEYEAAQWFDRNLHGQRVFAPGSVGFWLTVFNDTPQLIGGFEQGTTNDLIPAMVYQVYTGDGANGREGEIGELWLKAFGVRAVMVGGPHSREVYKPFHNPNKFAGRFRELWRDGDDAIYEVPGRTATLAHAMRPQDLAPRRPAGGLDVDPLRPYVAALDNPAYPPADFRWLAASRAEIAANLERGQILSVQISYHRGWHARANGRECRTWRDPIGMLAVAPACDGPCKVELSYDGGAEMLVARILSWGGLLGGIVWIVWARRQGRST